MLPDGTQAPNIMHDDDPGADTQASLSIWPGTFVDADYWATILSGTTIMPNQTRGWTHPPAENADASYHTKMHIA